MVEYPNADFLSGKAIVLLYGGYHNNCNITLSMLAEVEKRHGNIKFIKVNTAKYYNIKQKYQIKVLPSMLYFIDGKIVNQISGSFSFRQIEDMILRS